MQCWDLGAEHVLVRGDLKSLAGKVRELTGKRGVDVVFEHTGAATWATSLAVCARGGRIVTCGATTGRETAFDLRALFAKQIQIRGSYMGRREHLWTLLSLLQKSPTNPPFRPVIDRIFDLAEYPEAQRHLEAGTGFGKVACRVA
jgi:NADPH:quinone reductase-like Zn-dependent oxidoreductase